MTTRRFFRRQTTPIKAVLHHHHRGFSKSFIIISLILSLFAPPSNNTIITTTLAFEPYNLNGGLITAVAGRDYILIASDSRLSSGYEILSRNYLNSRIWKCDDGEIINDDEEEEDDEQQQQCSASSVLTDDGSLSIPPRRRDDDDDHRTMMGIIKGRVTNLKRATFVGSAGCAADCETLKRLMRMEVNAHTQWMTSGSSGSSIPLLGAKNLSTLLGHILYSRRSFPYYSFCLLVGFDEDDGSGMVHVYDAIGSHERVSVACAGVGREMMQPILDRLFSMESARKMVDDGGRRLRRDENIVTIDNQRKGLSLRSPVKVTVECDMEEALGLLLRGYRSVAEREISVGDDVIVCMAKMTDDADDGGVIEIRRFPLKKH